MKLRSFALTSLAGALIVLSAAPARAASITYHAFIEVTNTTTSASLGYVTKNTVFSGQESFGPLANALLVNFTLNGVTSASGVNLTNENSNSGFPFLGLIQGRDDTNAILGPGSFHYAYITSTNSTPAGSPPQNVGNSYSTATGTARVSASAVWTVDVVTGSLVPVWINPDLSTPTLDLFSQSTTLYAGGDAAAFFANYPAPITPIALTLRVQSFDVNPEAVPEPTSILLLGTGILGTVILRFRRKS